VVIDVEADLDSGVLRLERFDRSGPGSPRRRIGRIGIDDERRRERSLQHGEKQRTGQPERWSGPTIGAPRAPASRRVLGIRTVYS
jgi:hypothetical protein